MIAISSPDGPDLDALLATLANMEALAPLGDVAAALELEAAELAGLIDEADEAGLIQPWPDAPGGPVVCLSSLAAERLGVTLISDPDPSEPRWRWVRPALVRSEVSRAHIEANAMRFGDDGPGPLAEAIDPNAVDPGHGLMMAEAFEPGPATGPRRRGDYSPSPSRWAAAVAGTRLFRISLVIGTSIQWPVAMGAGPCPACHGGRLPTIACCICCDRSGVDHLLPAVSPLERPRPARTPKAGKPRKDRAGGVVAGLRGGLEV